MTHWRFFENSTDKGQLLSSILLTALRQGAIEKLHAILRTSKIG